MADIEIRVLVNLYAAGFSSVHPHPPPDYPSSHPDRWWLHEAEAKAKDGAKDMALEWHKALEGGCSNLVNSDNRPNQIELWSGYEARNSVMYIPEGEGSFPEDKPSKPREIVS